MTACRPLHPLTEKEVYSCLSDCKSRITDELIVKFGTCVEGCSGYNPERNDKDGGGAKRIILIVVVTVVVLILIALLSYFIMRRRRL